MGLLRGLRGRRLGDPRRAVRHRGRKGHPVPRVVICLPGGLFRLDAPPRRLLVEVTLDEHQGQRAA